jgi:hypothetical protein
MVLRPRLCRSKRYYRADWGKGLDLRFDVTFLACYIEENQIHTISEIRIYRCELMSNFNLQNWIFALLQRQKVQTV